MANNERVSQLIEIFAADLHSEDIFLLTDMSQRESKKLELGQLLLFFENSGSFVAFDSAHADTASYVLASSVDGTVATANMASQSVSSSWAFKAVTSSFAEDAETASFATWCSTQTITANTASFLQYSGGPNGTASYAIRAALADNASSAFSLFYNGSPNGTASWAIRAINSNNSDTGSYADSFLIGRRNTDATIYPLTIVGAQNDGVNLFVSGTIDNGTFYLRTVDNGTEPFSFQSHDSNNSAAPVDRMNLTYTSASGNTARLTVFGEISASAFTSSISNGVGFLGTASVAVTASSVARGALGPTFITPVTVVSTVAAVAFTTFDCTAYVPVGTQTVILDGYAASSNVNTVGFTYIRASGSANPSYILNSFLSQGSGDDVSVGGQGTFPINSTAITRSFQYSLTQAPNVGGQIRLIGYY